ncbi:response regulator, partial [bacterium]
LPLSKQLAHLLGGNISLRSSPGKGSTFSVTIPLSYNGPTEVAYGPEVILDLDATRLPVLIVEDNREAQFIYEKLLKGTGFQPVPARTLREAKRALNEVRPVAVLLDILLNHENTWDFLTELKNDPATRNIPVYVVTMVDNQQKAMALGADDFFAKPLDRTWLLNKLRQVESTRQRPDLLVIDDDEVSRYLLKGHLSDTYSRVLEASSGHEGIKLAQERHPAAIFLDLMMPDVDGFTVLEQLKSDESTKNIPVIVHSARHLSEQEKARLDRDAAAIVPKNPAEREATLLHIRKALHDAAVVMNKGEGVQDDQ